MRRWSHQASRRTGCFVIAGAMLLASGIAVAADTRQASASTLDELWQRGVDLVGRGDFEGATDAIKKIPPNGGLTDRVRVWLEEHETRQAARRELDRADLEKYVGYAQERIARKEYNLALEWALAAADCATDREAFLKSAWLEQLVSDALATAEELRKESDWRKAWRHYWPLADLYERNPDYKRLEREVLTHLRLDIMFGEDRDWEDQLEKVRWEDAKRALEYIGLYYVERADFKIITETGLEQMLLLAESKSVRERPEFEGLRDEYARNDFLARIQRRLDQVRDAPSLTWQDTKQHFRRVVRDINAETVRLPEELVVSELMRGALEPLDDFTTIIWPAEAREFEKHTRGDFIGVGISIIKNRDTDEIEVVTPLEDTPAYRAGIQAGDIITKVNGEEIKTLSLTKVVDFITGPKDTWVTLTVRRDDREIEFPLKRAKVKIQSVKGLKRDEDGHWRHWLDRGNGIGYVRVVNFQRNSVEDVDRILAGMEAEGLRGLVLDLRGNPGGLLDSAWKMSALFLTGGETVVSTRGRNPEENQEFPVRHTGPYADLPVVVLVDEHSASASEIVAGAIKDNHHGAVVGTRTFGKFSVQNLIPLSRSKAKLKLTTARYYLPSGVSLHRETTSDRWGVEPDIPVRLVRWERYNMYQMRRDADRLGPPKPETDDQGAEADAGADGDSDKEEGEGDEDDDAEDKTATADAEDKTETADAEEDAEDELPPLEQPDENNRPKEDPQLDTALLVMRVTLLGEMYPTVAAAEAKTTEKPGRP